MANQAPMTFRPDIQGLRAIAISLVVLAHSRVPAFSGGFIGVDVFFVISGYLITGLLIREQESNGRLFLARFYARRLKRLLPALLVTLIVVLLAAPHLLSRYEVAEQTSSIIYAATWTSNLFFAFSIADYFSELQQNDLFLHTWSLGLEEQFYLVWPILLVVAFTHRRGKPKHADNRIRTFFFFGLLFTMSLIVTWLLTNTHPTWAFYLMPSRIWQFALGGGVYVWFHRHRHSSAEISTSEAPGIFFASLGLAGFLLIFGSALFFSPGMTYPGFSALFPSLGATLLIVAGHRKKPNGVNRVLAHPGMVWIGDRSYSWYLWHWPILTIGFAWGMQSSRAATTALVLLSMLLAIISYRWVELPFWRGGLSHGSPSRTILLSILAILIVIVASQNRLSPLPRQEDTGTDPIATARTDIPSIYAYGCDSWYYDSDVRPCIIGDSNASNTVVLIGDSVGVQWAELFPGVFPSPEWRIVILTKSSCPMVDEDWFYERIGKVYEVCNEWRNKVLDLLPKLNPDTIFIGSAATYDFTESQWVNGSSRILALLTSTARQVVVIPGTPHLSFDGPSCLERTARLDAKTTVLEASACREELKTTVAHDVARLLSLAVLRFPNASLLNLNDLVCPERVCSALAPPGIVVFRDNQHLTNTFVRGLIPTVANRLNDLGLLVNDPQ